jgi:DMSO/TMAO reductase YedYZ molybdopterin-dependent catalytic subunit
LAKGATPRVDLANWRFTIKDGPRPLASWTWAEFEALPQTIWRGDIHCVTKWSKLDTTWSGVTIDDLLQAAGITPPSAYLLAESHDDYDTNVPVADLLGGKAMIATRFAGVPLEAEHGGPARLRSPLISEEREVDQRPALHRSQRQASGVARLSHLR